MLKQGHPRGRANHLRAIIGGNHYGPALRIASEITRLIGQIPLIEIGPITKDRDAQPCQIGNNCRDLSPAIDAIGKAHAET